jgi:aryl-alcohol dehydrogenase-like predicted oxidoreductase
MAIVRIYTWNLIAACSHIPSAEEALGKWFTATGRRSEVFLATKFGSYDVTAAVPVIKPISKPSYIRSAVERSLSMLKTDYIDLYYQHRIDPEVPIEIVLEALRPFIDSGKIKWLGLCECSAQTLRRAKSVKGIGEKVIAVQMEYSPFELAIENSGVAAAAKELGIAVVAYSPLSRGLISGKWAPANKFDFAFANMASRYRSRAEFEPTDLRLLLPRFNEANFSKNVELADKFQAVADKYNATSSQVALAWIMAEHPHCSLRLLFSSDLEA